MGSKMTPPPIIVLPEILDSPDHKTAVACVQRLAAEISCGKGDFGFKYAKNGSHIYVETKKFYELLIKYMQFQGQDYFTFRPPWNKSKQIILKGIFGEHSELEIINDLATKGVTCLKIDVIGERWDSIYDPIYLLELAEDTDLEEVKEIRDIQVGGWDIIISWQDYIERRNRPVQCYRCQRFHHRANYCYMTPQCVFCADQHFSKDCEKKKDTPKCFNCAGQHKADDRECPEWILYKDRLSASREKYLQKKR